MFALIDAAAGPTPHARGVAYGRGAREQIARSVSTYTRLFADCGIDWAEAMRRALRHEAAIQALDPSLLDELHGIAWGSAQGYDAILALNCRTEILPPDYLDEPASGTVERAGAARAANRAAGVADWTECTALCVGASASTDGNAWLAQNWDWFGRQRDALVVLRTRDAMGRQITTLTEGGMLAKIGLNDAGFALGLNIVRSRDDGLRPGVPVHVLLRHLLSCTSLEHARATLRAADAIGFGAASNIPCADAAGDIGCFELAPAGWAELESTDGTVVHTNHFLCEPLRRHQAPLGAAVSSASRLATAARHAARPPLGLAQLQAFLRDDSDGYLSVCRAPDPELPAHSRIESVAGIIIHPHSRQMWIAPDVPNRVAFTAVDAAASTPQARVRSAPVPRG
jgi:isopenicillin-N N-acyltransferase-like protein